MSSDSSKWDSRSARRRSYLSHWALILIPILFLAVLAFYFLLVDVGIMTAVIEERGNGSDIAWTESSQVNIELGSVGPNRTEVGSTTLAPPTTTTITTTRLITILQSLASAKTITTAKTTSTSTPKTTTSTQTTVIPTTKQPPPTITLPPEKTIAPKVKLSNANSTVILLKKDNNGTEFLIEGKRFQHPKEAIEVISPPDLRHRGRAGIVFDDSPSKPLTTPKGFQYTPTVPKYQPTQSDSTTSSYNETIDVNCFSPRIPFCEGVLSYDMVQLPRIPDVNTPRDLDSMLPYFQLIVQSGCSQRAREFICAVLQPECTPPEARPPTPCKVNCKVLSEDCKDFILETLPLSRIFDCRRYPDWNENKECTNLSKGTCFRSEFTCPDGSCIPRKWICDGVHDCPGSRPALDEQQCTGCSSHEFRCIMDGHCIPRHWQCDGMADCADYSDESSC